MGRFKHHSYILISCDGSKLQHNRNRIGAQDYYDTIAANVRRLAEGGVKCIASTVITDDDVPIFETAQTLYDMGFRHAMVTWNEENKYVGLSIPELQLENQTHVLSMDSAKGTGYVSKIFASPVADGPDYIPAVLAAEIYSDILYNLVREHYGACYTPSSFVSISKAPVGMEYLYNLSDPVNFAKYMNEAWSFMADGNFVEPSNIQGNKILITGSDVNHIKNVLRMKVGEEISVSNGIDNNDYRCEIAELNDDLIICKLMFIKEDGLELKSKIYLFQGLPKSDKMELIIQKAVELGVFEIVPVATKRAVVKLDEKKAKSRIVRWQAISEAAAKQSKRAIIPLVHDVMSFKEAINYAKELEINAIPYELAKGMEETKAFVENALTKGSIGIFIGPEGGFAEEEIEYAMTSGVTPVSLGKRILRTETAGMTMLSILMYNLEINS